MMRWLKVMLVIGSVTGMAGLGLSANASAATEPSPGTFDSASYLKVPDYASSVAIGKVTGNYRNDLVVDGTYGNDGYLWMFPQEKNGRLGSPQKIALNDVWGDSPVFITDLYGNGAHEVVLTGTSGLLVFGNKDGKLTKPTTIHLAHGVADFAVANVNGDKYPDIVASDADASAATIYYGSARHTFTAGPTLKYPNGGVWYEGVFSAAFRKGDTGDIAFYDGRQEDLRLRSANGSYSALTAYKLAPIDGQAFLDTTTGEAVGDLTGDGLPDLVLAQGANQPWAGVEVFADTRSGQLSKPAVYQTLDSPGQMTIADLTGNGRNDLVIEHDDWQYVGVMMQGSDHALSPEVLYKVTDCCGFEFGGPAVADLNGDGRPDIAVAAGNTVAVLYQK